ncbi:DUF427 domain-containing protein [Bradyrhizobium sp. HKCCYLS20291]|uniref:DUF427 domain-containing protein n=1 Tax=Bradyrhizobium sp. HKCCYLS20291 TaxID=3420766 RepID=UPI003EBF6049
MQRIAPGPGQESVWDYPRPPRLERCAARLRVVFAGETIAETQDGCRVLETSHPPVYYIPPQDVAMQWLRPAPGRSFCEFKGVASYWTIEAAGRISEQAAWSYPQPTVAFAPIAGYLAFYASRVDACFVGDERVAAQQGDFYGGWITSAVVGPFKGAPGTRHW